MKFMKYLNLIILAAIIVTGCSSKPESSLDKKREELTKAEASLDSIQKAIAEIKEEIT